MKELKNIQNNTNLIYRSKAPLRLGIAGGGTDVSPYCDNFGGLILNATINMFCYATIKPRDDGKIVFHSFDILSTEEYNKGDIIDDKEGLRLLKGVYKRIIKDYNNNEPLSFTLETSVDSPIGSGLGTSSSLVVAIISCFAEWLKLPLGEYDIASLAFEIEREDLELAGGKQDQYAAAFGGVNFMEFYAKNKVIVNPLRIKDKYMKKIEKNLVLYYTGVSRKSENIIIEQKKNVEKKSVNAIEATHKIKQQAINMKEILLKGSLDKLGEELHESWLAKKEMASSISDPTLDMIYQTALEEGSTGGRLSGAGGGGFFIFYCPDGTKERVTKTLLEKYGGEIYDTSFYPEGVISWTNKQYSVSDLVNRINNSQKLQKKVLEDEHLLSSIIEITDIIITAYKNGNKVKFCGNGGSAADAQHLAAELSGKFYLNRDPLDSEALHVNTSYLTAVANDYSYDEVFARISKAQFKKGDIIIGLSTSGNSKNVIKAFEEVKKKEGITIGLTGEDGGDMNSCSDYIIKIPSNDTPRIQEMQMLIGHTICEFVEDALYGENNNG